MIIAWLIKNVAAIMGATLLFWVGLFGGVWWEHRPANWPNFHVHVLFWNWDLGFGLNPVDKLQVQLDAANKALVTCHGNVVRLQAGIDAQNAAVERQAAAGTQALAEAEKAVSASRSATAAASSAEARILAAMKPAGGSSVCAQYEAVAAAFQDSLK